MPVTHAQIVELRRERKQKHEQAAKLLAQDPSKISGEDLERIETLHKEIDADLVKIEAWEQELDTDYKSRENDLRRKEAAARQGSYSFDDEDSPGGPKYEEGSEGKEGQIVASPAYAEAFASALRTPFGSLKPAHQTALVSGQAAVEGSSFDDISLGYLLPTEPARQMQEAMKHVGGMLTANLNRFTTETGNDIPVPVVDDTQMEGEFIEENVSHEGGVLPATGVKMIRAYTLSSKLFPVPNQFIRDMGTGFQGWLFDLLSKRNARTLNKRETHGSGVGCPEGILNRAVLGHTAAATNTLTYDEWVTFQHSVDPDYRAGAEFQFHDDVFLANRLIKDLNGLPIWQLGMQVGAPDTFLGKRFHINQDMDSLGASKKIAIYGDHKYYWERKVGGPLLIIARERYIEVQKTAFGVLQRVDGRLIDAGGNPVKYLQMAAS